MTPAYSVILFTTASGAGYGLLFWLAASVLFAGLAPTGAATAAGLVGALALVTVGLLSSTLHLGRPERAWRALSQWRTSWLSREGVLALATYGPSGLWLLLATGAPGSLGLLARILAVATAVAAMATVWSTGMIYQSLPTIRAWSDELVAPIYVLLALATGAVLMALLLALTGTGTGSVGTWAAGLLVAAAGAKWRYWQRIDNAPRTWTAGNATGLGRLVADGGGHVRPIDPPHTLPNFVMREMGFRVARRHAQALRLLAVVAGFLVPSGLLLLAGVLPGMVALPAVAIAVVGVAAGLLVERWLFFAEAQHVVTLFYGQERA